MIPTLNSFPPSPESGRILPTPIWRVGSQDWAFRRPLIMGVLNVTPDSFSDGGAYPTPERALERAREMVREGADIIDVGGASSHPKAPHTSPLEEWNRLAPVIALLAGEIAVPLSLDTQHPSVAEAGLERGIHIINDVSGLSRLDVARVAAQGRVPLVITYNNFAIPKQASGLSFLSDMLAFFDERIDEAENVGVDHLILDPGYGFGKTLEENMLLLRNLPMLRRFNRPVLVCTSRKGSLGALTGEAVPHRRLGASLASTLYAVAQGAHLVRVHDVRDCRQALSTWAAIERFRGEIPQD